MTKKTKKPKQQKNQQRHQQSHGMLPTKGISDQKSKRRILGGIISAISLLLAVVGFYFYIPPRISITQGDQLNPYNPFENPLVIKNNGYFPIEAKSNFELKNVTDVNHNTFSGGFGGFGNNIPKLEVEQSTPIDISRLIKAPPSYFMSGDLSVITTAKNLIIPYTKVDKRNFQIKKTVEGKYVWSEFAAK